MYGLLATSLFLGLAQAATVFLSPQDSLPPRLSLRQANLVLAAHLGLEQFEVINQSERLNYLFRERGFVGQGDQSALLLLVDEAYVRGAWCGHSRPSLHLSRDRRHPTHLPAIVLLRRVPI